MFKEISLCTFLEYYSIMIHSKFHSILPTNGQENGTETRLLAQKGTKYAYSIYIALKHCTSHKTSTACFSPAHEYTLSQILHIYGVSVVICGGLPTRQAASNHH